MAAPAIPNRSALFLSSLLLVTALGCAMFSDEATPQEKYVETQEAYIVVVSSLLTAKQAGGIDQARWDQVIEPSISEGNRLLDQMEVMVANDSWQQVELLRQALFAVLIRLQAEEATSQ